MLYKLFIGSNNATKRLEDKKAIRIVAEEFEGFTAYKGLGYWQGESEKCLILEIEARSEKRMVELSRVLGKRLKQEAIGLAKIGKLRFIS